MPSCFYIARTNRINSNFRANVLANERLSEFKAPLEHAYAIELPMPKAAIDETLIILGSLVFNKDFSTCSNHLKHSPN